MTSMWPIPYKELVSYSNKESKAEETALLLFYQSEWTFVRVSKKVRFEDKNGLEWALKTKHLPPNIKHLNLFSVSNFLVVPCGIRALKSEPPNQDIELNISDTGDEDSAEAILVRVVDDSHSRNAGDLYPSSLETSDRSTGSCRQHPGPAFLMSSCELLWLLPWMVASASCWIGT